ncbi:MAG: hypothetical protein HOH66_16500 [Rhodospirillaceae bacterium]|nr:hypothetical protein [Rhodospirillaceae bacterium]MBT6119467.1 hypothetical protein [Rhodospirillaceae bacterium]
MLTTLAAAAIATCLAGIGPALAASERCVAVSNGSGKAAWVGIRNPGCATEANGYSDLCAHGGLDDGNSASFCPRPDLGLGDRFGVVFIQDGKSIECEELVLSGHGHLAVEGVCITR